MSASAPKLRRSRRLSLFQQGDDVYIHHDLTGDILRMDRALLAFIDFFVEPREPDEAHKQFASSQFNRLDIDQFLAILPEHNCLVPEGADEEEALDGWFPMRGPWTFVYAPSNGELELGYVDRRTDEVVLEKLTGIDAHIFRMCDGDKSLRDIWSDLSKESPEEKDLASKVRAVVFRLTHSDRQMLKLAPDSISSYEGKRPPAYLESTMPFARLREADVVPAQGTVASTHDYHRSTIVDADDQFDVKETTLSHAFRVSHPALGGKTYGGRLAKVFVERDILRDDGARTKINIVEVGGGTGYFAAAFLDGLAIAAPRLFHRVRYTIVDLSSALQASQRERTRSHREKVRLVQGDATRLPLPSGSVDLLIANEMIADLETARVARADLGREDAKERGALAVRRFKLPVDDAPEVFWVNAGACELVDEARRVLRPGGQAIATEFGELDRYPVESTHLDHREFSIHFGHVRAAAEAVGLEARVEAVPDLIELDERVPVLSTNRSFFVVLRAFLARAGVKLEKLAYTTQALMDLVGGKVELERVQGLRFQPCGERVLGLRPREFKALLLTKPESGKAAKAAAPPRRTPLDL